MTEVDKKRVSTDEKSNFKTDDRNRDGERKMDDESQTRSYSKESNGEMPRVAPKASDSWEKKDTKAEPQMANPSSLTPDRDKKSSNV